MNWIKFSDCKPQPGEKIAFVWGIGGYIEDWYYNYNAEKFIMADDEGDFGCDPMPTHWMLMPEEPK